MKALAPLALIAVLLSSCDVAWPWKKPAAPARTPLEGTVRLFDDAQRLDRVMRYENGVLSGPCTGYWSNGKLKWQVNYLAGKKHGIQRLYFESGALRSEAPYIEGSMTGVVTEYDILGRLVMEIPVKDGRISGQVVRYHYESGAAPVREAVPPPPEGLPHSDFPRPRFKAKPTREAGPVDPEAMIGEQEVPDILPEEGPFAMERTTGNEPKRWYLPCDGAPEENCRGDEREARREARRRIRIGRMDSDPYALREESADPCAWRKNPVCLRGENCPMHGHPRSFARQSRQDESMAANTAPAHEARQRVDRSSNGGGASSALADLVDRTPVPRGVSRRDGEFYADERPGTDTRRARPVFEEDAPLSSAFPEYREDPDALSREFLIRQWERKNQTAKPGTILVRQGQNGTEYLVYPEGGARETEAWRVRMLKRGLDPNEAIRRGI